VEESRELPRSVETPRGEILPPLFLQDPPVELIFPEDLQGLALSIIVRAG
jgi:hypothetical protein